MPNYSFSLQNLEILSTECVFGSVYGVAASFKCISLFHGKSVAAPFPLALPLIVGSFFATEQDEAGCDWHFQMSLLSSHLLRWRLSHWGSWQHLGAVSVPSTSHENTVATSVDHSVEPPTRSCCLLLWGGCNGVTNNKSPPLFQLLLISFSNLALNLNV